MISSYVVDDGRSMMDKMELEELRSEEASCARLRTAEDWEYR